MRRFAHLIGAAALVLTPLALPATAAALPLATMSITPIGWNVVGLDSNKVTDGPNRFHIGAKVCNTGATALTDVTLTWTWDSVQSSLSLDGAATRTRSTLAAGACAPVYFGVQVVRDAASYDTTRRFHITAAAAGASSVSTPTPRELYVEKLVSQNRNSISSAAGSTAVTVGQSYTYTFTGATATGGYEQFTAQPYFDPSIFAITQVTRTTSVVPTQGAGPDQFYSDACTWQNDPAVTGTYRSCTTSARADKAGGTFTVTVKVDVVGTGTSRVSTLVDDFSGSSYHYNADYSDDITSLLVTASEPVVPHPPVASDDSATTNEDTARLVDVPGNDTDVDGDLDTTSVTVTSAPSHGTAVPDANTGKVTYTPSANYHGPDAFGYRICDLDGLCDTADVTLTVTSVNDVPVAVDDSAAVTEGVARNVTVLSNDSDADDDPLTVTVTTQPSHGSVVVESDRSATYTPAVGYHGPDSFTYGINDGHGGTAVATVTLTSVNTAPDARSDDDTTDEDTPRTVTVLTNDTDPENDALTVTGATNGSHGTTAVDLAGTGVVYTPASNFHGADSFTYTVSDGHGGTDTATVTMDVTSVNDGPDAVDDTTSTPEDTAKTFDVVGNDTDPDTGDTLTVSAVTQGSHGTVTFTFTGGTVTYTPTAGYHGADSFTYTVSDGHGGTDNATVTMTVTSVNDGPDAVDDATSTAEDTAKTFDVVGNDTDPDTGDTLTVSAVTQGSHGTVTSTGGTVTYTPTAGYHGADTFTYTVSDGHGGTDTATVTMTVTSVDDAPVAVDDEETTDEDTAVTVHALANDSDADLDLDPSSVDVTTPASHGTTTVESDGDVVYTPDADYAGPDSFSYEVCDTSTPTPLCDVARVDVTVTPENDAPVAVDDEESTDEDTAVTVHVLTNDTDPDGHTDLDPASVTLVTGPGSGPSHGVVTAGADGDLVYTPNPDFHGTDSFGYRVCDLADTCDLGAVTVTVASVDDAPAAVDDSATTSEDTSKVLDVAGNDTDADGDLVPATVRVLAGPSHGTATVVLLTGSVAYTPTEDFHGADSFTYKVCDATDLCDTATVTLDVTSVDDGPVAGDDSASAAFGTAVTVPVLGNDTDADDDHSTLTVTHTTTPGHGTVVVNGDGTVTYAPAAGFSGTDSFDYTVSDTHEATDTATVTVTVAAAVAQAQVIPPVVTPVVTPPVVTPAVTPDVPVADPDYLGVEKETSTPGRVTPVLSGVENASGSGVTSVLPSTGLDSTTASAAAVGLVLVVAGGGVLVLSRRRRQTAFR